VMRKMLFSILAVILVTTTVCAQGTVNPNLTKKNNRTRIGLKAGYDWSYVIANQSGLNLNNHSGYMFGAFLAPPSHGLMGYRTELIYSHQGFTVSDGNTTK